MKCRIFVVSLILLGLCPMAAEAQVGNLPRKPTKQSADEQEVLITKVYSLVNMPTPVDKAFRPSLPTTEDLSRPSESDAMRRGGMGGMGGGMGGMGGGMGMMNVMDGETENNHPENPNRAARHPNSTANPPTIGQASPEFDFDSLIDVITLTIAPLSWDRVGGLASIQPYRNQNSNYLVISQTKAVHDQILELLTKINTGGPVTQNLVIEAYWLLLDSAQLDQLRTPAKQDAKKTKLAVNPKVLEEFVRTVPGFRGQITCINNQTVHIVAGDRRNVVLGAVPVVGGADAGYQPITANVNVGALLQICPAYIPGMNSATVDINSTVTSWREGGEPVKLSSTTPPLDAPTGGEGATSVKQPGKTTSVTLMDHLQLPAHQLACTLKIPLGKPVLVGGLTLDPTNFARAEKRSDDAKDAKMKPVEKEQLYLILRVSECEDD